MGHKQTEETKQKIRDSWRSTHLPISDETKAKMSIAHTGVSRSEEFCIKNGLRTKGKRYMLGKNQSDETKRKISKSHIGKILSEVTRNKLKEAWKIGKENRSGEHCGAWKGGVTPINALIRNSAEYNQWRNAVYKRDYWTCQECGMKNGIVLNAHHIKSFSEFPELRFEVSNGVTLCEQCHSVAHTKRMAA
jgi:hypothetical protein